MKKIIEDKFMFLFLIMLGVVMLSWSLFPIYITYLFVAILFTISGYKLNITITKLGFIKHDKVLLYSICEISLWSFLIVVLQGFNNWVTILLTIAFYLSLFTVLSTFVYVIIKSIDNKDKSHFQYLIFILIFLGISILISNAKELLNNDVFIDVISLYYNITITMLVTYMITIAIYKCFKLNSK